MGWNADGTCTPSGGGFNANRSSVAGGVFGTDHAPTREPRQRNVNFLDELSQAEQRDQMQQQQQMQQQRQMQMQMQMQRQQQQQQQMRQQQQQMQAHQQQQMHHQNKRQR